MRLKISSDAKADLIAGYWFYEAQELGLGARFRDQVMADIEKLRDRGGIHVIIEGRHRALCKKFPYAIFYRVVDDESVVVLAVVDQRRDPDWIRRRLG